MLLKSKKWLGLVICELVLVVLSGMALLFGWLITNARAKLSDEVYGSFNSEVVMSYGLGSIMEKSFGLAGYQAIEEVLSEYYLPKYSKGVGLGLVDYRSFDNNYMFRIITSYGEFQDIAVKMSDALGYYDFKVRIGDYEEDYELDYLDTDEEFDDDD